MSPQMMQPGKILLLKACDSRHKACSLHCSAGVKIPAVEVRFQDLTIDTKINVSGSQPRTE